MNKEKNTEINEEKEENYMAIWITLYLFYYFYIIY